MPISKREFLAKQLSAFGVLRILESVALRSGLLVVNYHRLGDSNGNLFDDGVFSARPEDFEIQVTYLRRHFRLLNLTDLITFASNGFQFREPCALITFDDGYRDNFDLALPILRRHGVSAIFFVPTDYIENPHLPWWDHIAYVVKKTHRPILLLQTNPPVTIDLTKTSQSKAIYQILQAFKSASKANEAGFLSQLEDAADVQLDRAALGRELFMSVDNLRQMVDAGMGIGSHTHTHQILAQLPEADQRRELSRSRDLLQKHLTQPVTAISYPVGGPDKFTATTQKLCRELGYTLGFSFYGGINRPGQTEPLDIKRIGIDITDAAWVSRSRIVFTTAFGKTF